MFEENKKHKTHEPKTQRESHVIKLNASQSCNLDFHPVLAIPSCGLILSVVITNKCNTL